MANPHAHKEAAGRSTVQPRNIPEESSRAIAVLADPGPQAYRSATIHFSRKRGSGALEIAHCLAPRIGYRVIDREIIEYIAQDAQLGLQAVAYFDERFPGKLSEIAAMFSRRDKLFGDAYVRYLFSAVLALAEVRPTIFVGRGAHLILPRPWVLSVRIIASEKTRVQNLMRNSRLKQKAARTLLKKMDSEQRQYFRRVFGKRSAEPAEFDLIINQDHITTPSCAALVVENAFRRKFANRLPPALAQR